MGLWKCKQILLQNIYHSFKIEAEHYKMKTSGKGMIPLYTVGIISFAVYHMKEFVSVFLSYYPVLRSNALQL